MGKYGLPYQGCKGEIAEEIVDKFPKAKHFYDLFCGGGAITHCALLSGKFQFFHMNDKRPTAKLFKECIQGKHHDAITHWVSREEFKANWQNNLLMSIMWSFGNKANGSYMYGKHLEPWKRALHEWIVNKDTSYLEQFGLTPPSC